MHERIAKALLESVFYRVSAVVSLDECDRVMSVLLFSTEWPEGRLHIGERAKELWLISNHPDGCMLPDMQDCRNYQQIVHMAGSVPVRLFLASEYYPCFEAEISEASEM